MGLFKSGNPALSEKVFETAYEGQYVEPMTARGTMNKFGFLSLMIIAGATFTWHLFSEGRIQLMMPLMMVGVFGGLITAIVITFKRTWGTISCTALRPV